MRFRWWPLIFALLPLTTHATVTTLTYSVSFTCTGTTGPFPFAFPVTVSGTSVGLTVTQNGVVLSTSAYTTTPVNNNYNNGGSVTLNSSCPSSQPLVITRVTPLTQTTVYTDNMPVPMKTFEMGMDKLTEIDQELNGDILTVLTSGVYSFNTRTGYVTLLAADVDALGNLTNSTSGNAATSTALASTPAQCAGGHVATGVTAAGAANCTTLPLSCQPGIGDGLNAIPAGTYLQTTCKNETGQTWTITAIRGVSDNSGSSTVAVTNGAGTSLLTTAITTTSTYATGTQSATTTIAAGDYLKFTFVADGTSKQIGADVAGTW